MGRVVFAGAMSHAPAATGWPERASEEERSRFYTGAEALGQELLAAKPDVLLVFANDHVLNYDLDNMPDLAIGIGDRHAGPGDWFQAWLKVPPWTLPGDPETARAVHRGLARRGVRMAVQRDDFIYDENLTVPFALMHIADSEIPTVPVLMNVSVPPVMSSERVYDIGMKLRDTIATELHPDLRVALLATGGLSHEPGGPGYLTINREFDEWALRLLSTADHATCVRELTFERMEAAGTGGTGEMLAWLLVMGAGPDRPCEVLAYEAPPAWRCGMGVVRWPVGASSDA
ncbi:MAG: hypothetical protein ACP5QO_00570 [Clostridia bacterium]